MDFGRSLNYDPLTGLLTWKAGKKGRGCIEGREAGSIKADGRYRTVFLDGKRYYAHRIAWAIAFGPIPEGLCIDHIDGNGLNNRLSNLRVGTLSDNQRNRRVGKNSRTGVLGVFHHKNGYGVTCASEYVGHFPDMAVAIAARKQAEARMGFHPNHGRK